VFVGKVSTFGFYQTNILMPKLLLKSFSKNGIVFFIWLFSICSAWPQCGASDCNPNSGLYSNDDAANIAYDNFGSGFHATYIRQPDAQWKVWGGDMTNDGSSGVLSPTLINSTIYPLLTGTLYKVGIGGSQQMIILTSTGLFAVGGVGYVLYGGLTASSSFQKITVGGKADGLPQGVTPEDVKMLFATRHTLIITTCSGYVYVLSHANLNIGGNGGQGTTNTWSQVMIDATTPLTDIIVTRGTMHFGYALKSDGTLWTWGDNVFVGNGSPYQHRNFATQMTLPPGMPGIKMIQATNATAGPSYYILGTDKKVYALGINVFGQLGDLTTIQSNTWTNAKNPDGTIITDAAWISSNEHDFGNPALAVLRQNGMLYTAGSNGFYMIGRTQVGVNYLDLPSGIAATDVITQLEVGGHATVVTRAGTERYGYVGHRVEGSMGDGTNQDVVEPIFDFETPPIVYVCGMLCETPTLTLTGGGTVCSGSSGSFTIAGSAGAVVSYTINDGAEQTATIGAGGSVTVTLNNLSADQHIELTHILGSAGNCSNNLSITADIDVQQVSNPVFEPMAPVCRGDNFSLPSAPPGIPGQWQPAVNNMQTTVYTFIADAPCINPVTLEVQVYDSFDFEIQKYCRNGQLMLEVIPHANDFEASSAGYNWHFNGLYAGNSGIFNATEFQNSHAGAQQLPIIFDVTVDVEGCARNKSIVLENTYCDIQRGISPNADSFNDFFDLRLMDVSQLQIFNRYGVEIYSKSNYRDQWHGQTDKGKELPDGVYYYVIQFYSEPQKTGWIYLNKAE
jgi:gliding motility-associated-like protein